MQFKSIRHTRSRGFGIAGLILILSLVAWAQPAQDMKNMPGMKMPQTSPSPSASPQKMEMNMPGMQKPTASPNPQASPQQKMEMNMPMPAASPGASSQKMEMNMPMTSASPSASPMGQMPGMDMSGMNMDKSSLVVMSGTGMAVRLGASESNVMHLGQMGSGTSWQPTMSPMYMMDKIAGKWLLMAHFNFVVGLNSQGVPRESTTFESSNCFIPISFRR